MFWERNRLACESGSINARQIFPVFQLYITVAVGAKNHRNQRSLK